MKKESPRWLIVAVVLGCLFAIWATDASGQVVYQGPRRTVAVNQPIQYQYVQPQRQVIYVQPQPQVQIRSSAACPNCGRVHGAQPQTQSRFGRVLPQRVMGSAGSDSGREGPGTAAGYQIAKARANAMASMGLKNHPPRRYGDFASVGSFEGVGFKSGNVSPDQVPTCRPGRAINGTGGTPPGWRLVGDASTMGRDGRYRVRIWSR